MEFLLLVIANKKGISFLHRVAFEWLRYLASYSTRLADTDCELATSLSAWMDAPFFFRHWGWKWLIWRDSWATTALLACSLDMSLVGPQKKASSIASLLFVISLIVFSLLLALLWLFLHALHILLRAQPSIDLPLKGTGISQSSAPIDPFAIPEL